MADQVDSTPFYSLHSIDTAKTKPGASIVKMKKATEALEDWKKKLFTNVYEGEKRRFKFDGETCEVIALVNKICGGTDKDTCALRIAERLLEKETKAQEKYGHLGNGIQRGGLFQILTEYEDNPAYLMAKIEHEEILDETDFERHSGLPFDKHIFKTCLIIFDKEGKVAEVLVSDNKRKKISDYWAYEFLEVTELRSNVHNTRMAFKFLEAYVTKLKKNHRADYFQIRNNMIAHFRTKSTFSFADMVEAMVGEYEPYDPELDIKAFRAGLEKLPQKLKENENVFDSTFDIVQAEVKARFRKSIDLSDRITLNFKEDIPNLETIITAVEFNNGKKGIRIETEQGYEYFKKEKPADAKTD
jgi:hypothetical protein